GTEIRPGDRHRAQCPGRLAGARVDHVVPALIRTRGRHREVGALHDPAHGHRVPGVAHADPPRPAVAAPATYPDVAAGVHAVVREPERGQPGRRHLDRPALDVPGRVEPPGGVRVEVPV